MRRAFSLPLMTILALGSAMPLKADLIGLYQFNDSLNLGKDTSGHNNDAANTGGTFTASGFQDGGLVLNGAAFLRVPIDVNVTALPQLTWGAWAKPTTTASGQTVLSSDNGNFDRTIDIDGRAGAGPPYVAFTGGGLLAAGGAPSTTNYTFLAAVYNQATTSMTFYVDGQSVSTTTSFGAAHTFFDIGHNPDFASFFTGTIDNVFVYNQALTSTDIAAIRTNGFPAAAPSTPEPGSLTLLFGIGFSGVGVLLRRRKSAFMRAMGKPTCLTAGIVLTGMVGAAPLAHAQTFNANTAFLNFNSGSGPWTTGYEATTGSSLVLYDVFANNGTYQNYHSSVVFSSGAPTFEKNITGSTQFTVPAGGIALHPGPNNEYSLIRFTVPTTNTYLINSQFFAGDSGDTDATILMNNNTLSPLFFAGTTNTNPIYSNSVALNAGDVLDFLVGSKGNFGGDTTPLTLTITAAATPEPGSVAIFCGLGASGTLFALCRRRALKA